MSKNIHINPHYQRKNGEKSLFPCQSTPIHINPSFVQRCEQASLISLPPIGNRDLHQPVEILPVPPQPTPFRSVLPTKYVSLHKNSASVREYLCINDTSCYAQYSNLLSSTANKITSSIAGTNLVNKNTNELNCQPKYMSSAQTKPKNQYNINKQNPNVYKSKFVSKFKPSTKNSYGEHSSSSRFKWIKSDTKESNLKTKLLENVNKKSELSKSMHLKDNRIVSVSCSMKQYKRELINSCIKTKSLPTNTSIDIISKMDSGYRPILQSSNISIANSRPLSRNYISKEFYKNKLDADPQSSNKSIKPDYSEKQVPPSGRSSLNSNLKIDKFQSNNVFTSHVKKPVFEIKTKTKLIRRKSSDDVKKGMLLKAHQKMMLKGLIRRSLNLKHKNKYPLALRSKYKIVNKEKVFVSKYKMLNQSAHRKTECKKQNYQENNFNSNYKIDKRRRRSSIRTARPIGLSNHAQGKDLIQRFKIKRKSKLPLGKTTMNKSNIVSKYKLNRNNSWISNETISKYKKTTPRKLGHFRGATKSDKFINIGGKMYKTTRTTLKKQDLLKKKLDADQPVSKNLKTSAYKCSNFKLIRSHSAQYKNKPLKPGVLIEIVRKRKLGLLKKRNEFCYFYNASGKCKRNAAGVCPFVHDPDKVAICIRYVTSSCTVTGCTFSHKLDKSRMPVCTHFLNGTCFSTNCQFRHVKVNPKAPVCSSFIKGHCEKGDDCKKKHVWICEDFQEIGSCFRGSKCPLLHRRMRKTTSKPSLSLRRRKYSLSGNRKASKAIGGVLGERSDENKKRKSKQVAVTQRYFDPSKDATEKPFKDEDLNQKRLRLLGRLEKLKLHYNQGNDTTSTPSPVVIEMQRENIPEGDFVAPRVSWSPTSSLPSFISLSMSDENKKQS